jgi:hypothetical protein
MNRVADLFIQGTFIGCLEAHYYLSARATLGLFRLRHMKFQHLLRVKFTIIFPYFKAAFRYRPYAPPFSISLLKYLLYYLLRLSISFRCDNPLISV